MDIMSILGKELNFIRRVVEPPDGNYGVQIGNGKFNGIIGMLQNGTIDISTVGLTILKERSEVIDQLFPISTGYYSLVKMVSNV